MQQHWITCKDVSTTCRPQHHPCATCPGVTRCLPLGLDEHDLEQIEGLFSPRLTIKKGETLYRCGSAFRHLYAVRQGSFKTVALNAEGREQIMGFQFSAELLGLDAMVSNRHVCDAVALETSEVCPIHFQSLESLAQTAPTLLHSLLRVLGREIQREQALMYTLGNPGAEARLSSFLVDMSRRSAARGHDDMQFNLPMKREEIASYLSCRIETVSRSLTQMQEQGLIKVRGREISLLDMPALKALAADISP